MIGRRNFIAALLAGSVVPRLSWADAGSPAILGAAREGDGGYALFGIAADGGDCFRIPLPARGHAAAAHPSAPEAVAFARSPGRFAVVLNCVTGEVLTRLVAPEGRHFYGHGTFIAGGDILCTSENDFGTGQGRIGLWSRSKGWRRVGEIPTHGVGPHEIKHLPGDVLVAANGGYRNHPDRPGVKLDVPEMRPNLAYVSPDGELLEKVELDKDLHLNSIRHIALGRDGLVAFGMQWQGDPALGMPLMGLHRRGEAAVLDRMPVYEAVAMRGYVGSIAFDAERRRVAISSPRGGRVQVFDDTGRHLRAIEREDVCGIAPATRGFFLSDGLGGLMRAGEELHPLAKHRGRAWDHHLVPVMV
ncbi:DUF1513 domain-containing protein [Paracoccus methylarcula]|uniref:DUF1513 domain-containing protein n=1 Tax=Paracoccus methylarcula TaxID=72022 RepID=A0A3R7SD76_9RHOB|nr:DUF1513 domain-containing protein [Paracoccus methylarcula]RNF35196.1 DUF1513 domain-containing protein [Paracoccus methylarcula]